MKGKEDLSVISIYKWWLMDREEMRVLREIVYTMKSRGPGTELWGTQQGEVYMEENYFHM